MCDVINIFFIISYEEPFFSTGPAAPKTPNAFALFVKENYKVYKKPGLPHKDVMQTLSMEFKNFKLNG